MKAKAAYDVSEREFEYPYDKSLHDIREWRDFVGDIDAPQGYFLHKDDLLFLINELMNQDAKGMGIRCYPARDAEGENHLLMVAVVEDEDKIMYPHGKDIYSDTGQSRIFDLTRPCPNMCDPNSALFAASKHKLNLPLGGLKPAGKKDD